MKNIVSLLSVAILVTGCDNFAKEISAEDSKLFIDGNNSTIEVIVDKSDLVYIAKSEIYISIKVVKCDNGEVIYPSYPYLKNIDLTDFDLVRHFLENTKSNKISIYSRVPTKIFSSEPLCTIVSGGNFFGAKVISESIPIFVITLTRAITPK